MSTEDEYQREKPRSTQANQAMKPHKARTVAKPRCGVTPEAEQRPGTTATRGLAATSTQ